MACKLYRSEAQEVVIKEWDKAGCDRGWEVGMAGVGGKWRQLYLNNNKKFKKQEKKKKVYIPE